MTDERGISVLVVDDEAPARDKLKRYVDAHIGFYVIGEAKNGEQAIELIDQLSPQLLLLDIQMPGLSGFDVLRLKTESNTAVVFTTAYDQYAVQAFDVSAVDYLLKPINETRLHEALDKVAARQEQSWDEKVSDVLRHLKQTNYIDHLPVRFGRRTKILRVDDISLIRSEHRLVHVYDMQGQRHWTNEGLTQLSERLDPQRFMRVHRGVIINLNAQFDVVPWSSGRLKLLFQNELEVIVSRVYTATVKDWFSL